MTDAPPPAAAEADQAWRAALASLDEMTGFDRPRRPVSGCEHCVPEADARTLMEVAREEAPERLMDRYGFNALTTWGDARDLRWFLPRLVELLAVEPNRLATPSIVADKAVMAGFATWPDEERATLRGAFLAPGASGSTVGGRGGARGASRSSVRPPSNPTRFCRDWRSSASTSAR
jgi:hypothetical protein